MSSWDSSSSSTTQNRKNKRITSQETRSAIDVRHFVSEYRAKTLLLDPGTSLTTARIQYIVNYVHYLKRSRRSYGNQQSSQSSRSSRNFWKRLGRSGRSGRSYGNQALLVFTLAVVSNRSALKMIFLVRIVLVILSNGKFYIIYSLLCKDDQKET